VYGFGSFVKDEMVVAVWFDFLIFYSVPLVFMLVFVPIPCCFAIMALEYNLKSSTVTHPVLFLLLRITFGGNVNFAITMEISTELPQKKKKGVLVTSLGRISLSTYKRDICTLMFLAALFTIAALWNQPKSPTTNEWIKKI
jgi:hypothetical protein